MNLAGTLPDRAIDRATGWATAQGTDQAKGRRLQTAPLTGPPPTNRATDWAADRATIGRSRRGYAPLGWIPSLKLKDPKTMAVAEKY